MIFILLFSLLAIIKGQFVPGFLVESGSDTQNWPINFTSVYHSTTTPDQHEKSVSEDSTTVPPSQVPLLNPVSKILGPIKVTEETQNNSLEQLHGRANVCSPVAFSVSLSTNTTRSTGANGTQIQFKKVTTNIGRGYNSAGSFFLCECPGIYFFSFHCLSPLQGRARIDLMVNLNRIVSLEAPYYGYGTGSNSAIVNLKKNDVAFLFLVEGNIYENDARFRGYTSFTGFKIA